MIFWALVLNSDFGEKLPRWRVMAADGAAVVKIGW
jgi:hypothetical protein